MLKRACVLFFALALVGAGMAMAQKPESPVTHCDPSFATDIGPAITQLPNGSVQTVSGDCTATAGCDDFFDITCPSGASLFVTFCSGGGTADFDTGLSIWSSGGTIQDACNDDTCGLLSELTYVFPATQTVRMRVGGFGGTSGTYTLAYSAPGTCTIQGATPVELIDFTVTDE